jgi:hypothetical protein
MELLFSVIALIVLAVLAVRYGHDSRTGIQSKEQELAWFGMQWPEFRGVPVIRTARPVGMGRRVRRVLARGLLALADWLSPGTPSALARRA